jgi:spore germination cell wall hydrolase CwlJ-like protein
MNRFSRAAGFAAASVALAATATFSAPSQAEGPRAAIAAPASLKGATPQGIDAALDAVEAQVAPQPQAAAAAEKPGMLSHLWTAATNWASVAPAPAAAGTAQRSLDELVAAYAGAQTSGRDEDCLASAVYFEARGEPTEGQLAVAEVVLNRASSGKYPSDICAVVEQPWQFSFVNATGRIPNANRGSEAWRKAVAVARIAQGKLADSLPSNVLWYHADYVAPSWGKRLTRQTKIGLHIFYS